MLTDSQIAEAIARLRSQSNDEVKNVLRNAERRGVDKLVIACREELRLRGSLKLSAADAQRASEQAAAVAAQPLRKVIEAAFTLIPPKDYELALLRVIYDNPSAVFPEIESAYHRRDTSLVAGHLIYDRFGFFRQFLEQEKDQSSILIEKGKRDGHVTWRLKDAVAEQFRQMGIL